MDPFSETVFNLDCVAYFAQNRESLALTRLDNYIEFEPTKEINLRDKYAVGLIIQGTNLPPERTSVPINMLPRFLQLEIKPERKPAKTTRRYQNNTMTV